MKSKKLVMKFGGTSLETPTRFRRAARRVISECGERPVVVVVSAPGGTTDRIVQLIDESVPENWSPCRETERALTIGETLSAAVLAAILSRSGVLSESLTGAEAGLFTGGRRGESRFPSVRGNRVRMLLEEGVVPIVSGFQASNEHGQVVTLGRGGSDLTAVSLADALDADCHLITDVDGVFDSDPNQNASARLLPSLTHADLCTLCDPRDGSGTVIQPVAADLARRRRVHLRLFHHAASVPPACQTIVDSADVPIAWRA
jgi:aspartate kinase